MRRVWPGVLLAACSDHRLYGEEEIQDGRGTAAYVDDTGLGDTADTGEAVAPTCEPKQQLWESDGWSLMPESEEVTGLGNQAARGAAEVWTSLRRSESGTSQYLPVAASSWERAEIPASEFAMIYSAYTSEVGYAAILVSAGGTIQPEGVGAATLFLVGQGGEGDDASGWVWVEGEPDVPVNVNAAERAFEAEAWSHYFDAVPADYDGDGLDDLFLPSNGAPLLFLAPYDTTRTIEEGDVVWPRVYDNYGGGMRGAVALDLDGDGHLDMLWEMDSKEAEVGPDFWWFSGPVLSGPATLEPQGLVAGSFGSALSDRSSTWGGAGATLAALGDLTGDGRHDAAVASDLDDYGEPGSDVIFILDSAPEGTVELTSYSTRVVGPSFGEELTPGLGTSLYLGQGGDWNADGQTDLMAYHGLQEASGGVFTSWVLLGPLDGTASLAGDAIVSKLAVPEETDLSLYGFLTPDMTGDGADELFLAASEGLNRRLWLFPGCPE